MKQLFKLLLFTILLSAGLAVQAQETPPTGLKSVNAQFYIHLPDSAIWHQKGAPYGWERLARYKDLSTLAIRPTNGIYFIGDSIGIGGGLTQPASINLNSQYFELVGLNSLFSFNDATFHIGIGDITGAASFADVAPNDFALSVQTASGKQFSFSADTSIGFQVRDDKFNAGLTDYVHHTVTSGLQLAEIQDINNAIANQNDTIRTITGNFIIDPATGLAQPGLRFNHASYLDFYDNTNTTLTRLSQQTGEFWLTNIGSPDLAVLKGGQWYNRDSGGVETPYLKQGDVPTTVHLDSLLAAKVDTNTYDIMIGYGQSNWIGHGDSTKSPKLTANWIALQWKNGSMIPANDPVGVSATGSMWPAFANAYYARTKRKLIIIPCAVGGAALLSPNDTGTGYLSQPSKNYTNLIAKVDSAHTYMAAHGIKQGRIFMTWAQGETDATGIHGGLSTLTQYSDTLKTTFKALRTKYGVNMPIYIFKLGTRITSNWNLGIQNIQEQICITDPFTVMAERESADFQVKGFMNGDLIHWNQKGLDTAGYIGAQAAASGVWKSGVSQSFDRVGFNNPILTAYTNFHVPNDTTSTVNFPAGTLPSSQVHQGDISRDTVSGDLFVYNSGWRQANLPSWMAYDGTKKTLVVNQNASSLAVNNGTGSGMYTEGADNIVVSNTLEAVGNTPSYVARRAGGTGASKSSTPTGVNVGAYSFGGYNGTTAVTSASIIGTTSEAFGTGQGTFLTFNTTATGSTTNSKKMGIMGSGEVIVGTGSYTENSNYSLNLQNSNAAFGLNVLNSSQQNALTAVAGMFDYNSTSNLPGVYNGTSWLLLAPTVSPVFTTPNLGVATATSINKVAITAPATSATITVANGKTLTYNNSITIAGTDATTMTFPAASTNVVGNPNGALNILASTQTTLVAGTKALSVTGATTGSHAQVTMVSQSGTVTTTQVYEAVCTAGTVTINAVTNAGTNVLNTLDTSTLNVFVTN